MMKKRIFSLTLALCLLLSLLPGTAWAADDHKHNVCGGTSCSHDGHNEVTFTALSSITDNKLTEGSYYLSGNIENVSTTITVSSGTVNLCLNGHTISGTVSNSLLKVEENATLNICNCAGTGKITCTNGVCVRVNGTVNLYGGTVEATGSDTVVVGDKDGNSGTLKVDGATITGDANHRGVNVTKGKATITSGTVTGGSGLFAGDNTTLEITGGTIQATSNKNPGVYTSAATTISGGTISGTSEGVKVVGGSLTVQGDAVVKSTGTQTTNAGINATAGTVTVESNAQVEGFVGVLAGENVTKLEISGGTIKGTGESGGFGVHTKATTTKFSDTANITGKGAGVHVQAGAATMTGGAITGDIGVEVSDSASFTMENGEVTGSKTYGFYVVHSGQVTVSGGTVTGKNCGIDLNSTDSTTAAVTVSGTAAVKSETNHGVYANGGTVTISGTPTITGPNTSGKFALLVNGGTGHKLEGGTLSGYGGVKVGAGAELTMTGGTVTGTGTSGIEVAAASDSKAAGKLTVTGGTITSTGNGITNNGTTTIPGGSTVTVEEDGTTATVTVPTGGSDGTVDKDGIMDLPSGSTVTIGGTKVTLPDGGTVDPATGDVTPSNGGKVTVTDSSGKTTTVTPPSGGKVTVGSDGKISVPDGSTVQTSTGPEITVGSGNDGTVDPATGGVTVPNGGKVTISDGKGGKTEITPPNGGEVKPGADGGVEAPGGSSVTHTDSSGGTTSGTVPSGGGTVKPDGSVEGDTPAPDDGKLDSGETVNLTGGGTVKRDGDTVTIEDKNGTTTTITVPKGGEVTVDKDTGEVTIPAGSTVKTGDGTEITVPGGGTVKPGGEVVGSPVKVGDNTVTVNGGTGPTQGDITTNSSGETTLPGGTTATVEDKDGNKTTVTVPSGGSGTVSKDGDITLPSGGTVTVPGKDGGTTEITVPSGGGTVEKNSDGTLTAPAGSEITNKDKNGQQVGDKVTVPSGGQTVIPGGEPAPVNYIVTFQSNGGSAVAAQTVSKGGKATEPTAPTREGYTFKGWYADAEFNAPWNFGTALTGNLTLYARWEKNPVIYTVTFDANGGSAVASKKVTEGKLIEKPASPTLSGHTFLGWTVTKDGGDFWQFATATVRADMTLYAKWEAVGDSTEVKPGSPVTTDDGTKVEDKGDGTVTVTPPSSGGDPTSTITPPSGGDNKVTVDKETGKVNVPVGSTVTIPGSDSGDDITVKLPDGGKVDGEGNITLPDGGDAVTVPGSGGTSTTITAPDGGGIIQPDKETGGLKVPGGSTVQTGGGPEITVPNEGGTVNPGTGEITVPGGSTVTVPDGSGGKTEITVPSGGSSTIQPTNDGKVEVPEGSTVTTQDGTKITVTDGDKPVVKPDGEITLPSGGTVAIPDGTGGKTEITVPSGGAVKPTDDGRVEVPEGSTVTTQDGTKITVTDGDNPVVKPDGTVTIPGGGTVTITTPNGKTEIVTVPTGGTVDPVDYGKPAPGPAPSYGSDDDDDEPTYRPTVEKTSHGTVTVRPSEPEQGDRVTITVKPDKGYEVEDVTVTDRNGDPVKVKDNGNGTYTFTQPKGKVSIEATFRAVQTPQPVQPAGDWSDCRHDAACPIHAYTDADPGIWYHDGVHYCLQNGLMNGFTDGTFKPDATLSRAQLAQILYNLEGRPALNGASPFTDVANNAWCASAVIWANRNGIVGGYGNGLFGPNNPITREQLATMLWRYAKAKGYDVSVGENTNILGYNDFSKIHEYAIPALQWATGAGVMNGKGGGILDPIGRATRAQTAVMLQRYLENATH